MSTRARDLADAADMVVNGYAFARCEDGRIRVACLRSPLRATVLSEGLEVLETSMDDVEISIVLGYLRRNSRFLAASHA